MHAACPAHLMLYNIITLIMFGVTYKLSSSLLCSFSRSSRSLTLMTLLKQGPHHHHHHDQWPYSPYKGLGRLTPEVS
jgi:hypothetical protein